MTVVDSIIVSVLYEDVTPERPYERCCIVCGWKTLQAPTSGFGNLLAHLESSHEGYLSVVDTCVMTGKKKATPDMFPKTTQLPDPTARENSDSVTATTEADNNNTTSQPDTSKQGRSHALREHNIRHIYTKEDIDGLLTCLEEVVPRSKEQWEQVLIRFHEQYADPNGRPQRNVGALQTKFYALLNQKKNELDANCPTPIRRARHIKRRIYGIPENSILPVQEPREKMTVPEIVEPRSQSSDEETIPDEEMTPYVVADPELNGKTEALTSPLQRKRPRLSKPSAETQQALVQRVAVLESDLSTLQKELLSLCEVVLNTTNSLEEVKVNNSRLREEIAMLTGRHDVVQADSSEDDERETTD
ncbi:hypothetical protein Poli38472_003622 [Pythium oligandrum]|uniref:Uncharacterized protein n=1 Tax=Pythium oligandrum TaxID=41045 RepID=A0A8K1CLS8_PYTOL|nr:hypothetical protein Poli38472_003622 [Pythium oligandrum]|eukprot:TMW65857.1 hypothetical protein Poli38472_003622 [Pythium oligandrum]